MNPQIKTPARFFIRTLGCKVNQYESQAMRELLLKAGFLESGSKDMADIYIVNSCTVTEEADKEVQYLIGLFARRNPKAKILVTGCFAEKDAERVASFNGVWRVVRNDQKNSIVAVVTAAISDESALSGGTAEYPVVAAEEPLAISEFKDHTKAFVKIQDGCDNFCSYCKVPFVRPNLTSKPIPRILKEIGALIDNGFREIILTGICLGAWGRDVAPQKKANLIGVLKELEKIPGECRFRLSSIEPKYVNEELLGFIATSTKICRHLHIPFQSGDDETLKRMNRPYSVHNYEEIVRMARRYMSDVALTTDMIVGFPGEKDINFNNTFEFLRNVAPMRTHVFTFSKREGTAAYRMNDEVLANIAKTRYDKLTELAGDLAYRYASAFLNKDVAVLVESKRSKKTGQLTGYSDNYIKIMFDGPDDIMRKIVPVKLTEVTRTEIRGVYGRRN